VTYSLTSNIGHFGFWRVSVRALYISFFEGQMFSRWIVTNITSARGTLHCHKTHILCGDQFVISGLYQAIRHNNPEDSHDHSYLSENLKFLLSFNRVW
jgi:hypothetical protein